MDLEDMVSERSHSQRTTYEFIYMNSFHIYEIFRIGKFVETQNRSLVAKTGREGDGTVGWMAIKFQTSI